jgi:hypothetical protein
MDDCLEIFEMAMRLKASRPHLASAHCLKLLDDLEKQGIAVYYRPREFLPARYDQYCFVIKEPSRVVRHQLWGTINDAGFSAVCTTEDYSPWEQSGYVIFY